MKGDPEFVARYVCGECDYDHVDMWREHERHYQSHRYEERMPQWVKDQLDAAIKRYEAGEAVPAPMERRNG